MLFAVPAFGQIGYSNITNFTGFATTNNGAAASSAITRLLADDINLTGSGAVTGFTFSTVNFNAVAVTARALVRFYDNNGTGGGPGTFLGGLNFNPLTLNASSVQLWTYNPGTPIFTTDGSFWAGISFDNTGATATAAQLDNIGQGIFNPPTVGGSADVFFRSTATGSFAANNPTGSLLFFGGNPVANFGWQFTAVPEPGTVGLGGAAFAAAAAWRWLRRRAIAA
jgi:hypothetical protein